MCSQYSNANAIERELRNLLALRSNAFDSYHIEKANEAFDRLHVVLKEKVRMLPDRGAEVLKRISMSDDLRMRVWAAAALLPIDEKFAFDILKDVESRDEGLISFDATMTMREWKAGELQDYWD